MTTDGTERSASATVTDAWEQFTAALGAMGAEITAPPYPRGARELAEGYRYLGRLAVLALQWSVEFADPDFPQFWRHDDDITKWGGPNVDNRYLRARVRDGRTYRVRGNASTSYGFVLQLHQGDMQYEEHGIYGELWSNQIATDTNGDFEIVISADRHPGNWIQLHPDTGIISIREYFNDWEREAPGWFTISCDETEGLAPPPLTPEAVAQRLAEARRWATTSLRYWNQFVEAARGGRANHLDPPRAVAAGAAGIAYGSGFYDLADHEAMIIEGGAPDAWHWNYQLYNRGWFESLDIANRTTSLNGAQMHVDDDSQFRIVVAHRDPGTPNWLDTSGLRSGMIAYRYIHARSSPPVSSRVVPFDRIRQHLPDGTPTVTAEQRREQITIRQRHIARRFRQ